MIPLHDDNPTRRFPVVTVLLIAANIYVYFLVQRPGGQDQDRFAFSYAAIPCEVVNGRPLTEAEVIVTLRGDSEACNLGDELGPGEADPTGPAFPAKRVWTAVLYSMFLHGSLLHIGGNMLYLWVFGNNIEDKLGPLAYAGFYLLAGVVATGAHVLAQPDSTVPMVGASGAVAGVMGAYLVAFPNVQVRSLIIAIVVLLRDIPAKWLLGFWFVLQFFTSPTSGVAWIAHVGGFVFGVLVALALRATRGHRAWT